MNPFLPNSQHVPDSEAHVFNDRLYIYGSYDIPGHIGYCSGQYKVFSTDDMELWEDHGVSFRIEQTGIPTFLCAPDCEKIGEKYYLFYCCNGGREGVAVSDRPEGPFVDAQPIPHADGDGIDPAIFVDDDGQAYYYWGQFRLRGAKLGPDRKSIVEETFHPCLLDEYADGFHEGSSMRKRGDTYYLVYSDISRGKATCLAYATGKSPLGPFKKRGVIIDNVACDKGSWNNHGSICEYKGQWYVFYHRSSRGDRFSRRACVEPIYFDEEGLIPEVCMTTQGAGGPIPAATELEAWRACFLNGNAYTWQEETDTDLLEYLTGFEKGDWATYKYLSFTGEETIFEARTVGLPTASGCKIELSTGSYVGQHVLGYCEVREGEPLRCAVKTQREVNSFYLQFLGDCPDLKLVSFSFR